MAYNSNIWHEILTWFGAHFAGFEPEFNSAFSWEDIFSNLLGTRLAVKALQSEHDYDTAMTLAIDDELKKLGVQPKNTAIDVSEKMRGKWFEGLFLVDMKMRNLDIGLDGYVTPIIVPDVKGCEEVEAISYPVPGIDILDKYGFSMSYEIEPREWEKDKILKVVSNPHGKIKKINPIEHYPKIIDYIKKQAEARGYHVVD